MSTLGKEGSFQQLRLCKQELNYLSADELPVTGGVQAAAAGRLRADAEAFPDPTPLVSGHMVRRCRHGGGGGYRGTSLLPLGGFLPYFPLAKFSERQSPADVLSSG